MAQRLGGGGYLAAGWREAFAAVDRGLFLPDRIWLRGEDGYRPVDAERWEAAVCSDTAVVTQVADPAGPVACLPTSSAGMPRMVATMLAALRTRPGERVLEVGAGTGYNAALLAERLGEDHVTTIERTPASPTPPAPTSRHPEVPHRRLGFLTVARRQLRRGGHRPCPRSETRPG